MKHLQIFFASLIGLFLCLLNSDAKVVYVNAAAPAGGNGTSWTSASRYLQDALDLTVAGDEVWVASGSYLPDAGPSVTTGDRTATFTLKPDVKLYGGFFGGETSSTQRNPETNITVLSGEIWTDKIYWSLHVVTLIGNATLDGFTVAKGNANGESSPYNLGAGIYSPAPNATLALANCTFSDNTASSSGGAISSTLLTASNCSFIGNTASNDGGAIRSSSVTATDCSFSDNSASSGGAIYSSLLAVSNCSFSNNAAPSLSGGAISSASVTVVDSTFSGNTASSGGAIFSDHVTAMTSTFSNNASSDRGGAISSSHPSDLSSVTATSCMFSNNTAASTGGAVCSSSVTARYCIFSDNSARYAGAIYSSTLAATNCTFSSNSCTFSGGAIYSSAEVTVHDCTFSGNSVEASGGAIFSSLVTATDCKFSSNIASSAAAIDSSSLTVTNCIFSGNTASSAAAIHSPNLTATDCMFSGNTASSSGGAIDSANLTATNCIFSNNTASSVGGGIYTYSPSSSVTVTNCTFSNNTTYSSGGAIYSSSVTAANCKFSDNTASTTGGAIASSSTVNATNCTFSGNTATSSGGAIYSSAYSYSSYSSSVTATNCTFSDNTVSSAGGAIYFSSNDFSRALTLVNCTLVNNLARSTDKMGGAIYAEGMVKIINNIFWHTLAEPQDNLIYITSSGRIRNADMEFPSPSNQAKNLIKGGVDAITAEAGALVSLGATSVTIPSDNPLFLDADNPVGADGVWKTVDDGLRLQATSPAIDLGLSIFLPVDTYDLDADGNLTESIPVDLAGSNRIQGAAVDLGAYEHGILFQPILIVNQPVNVTISSGSIAKFTVTASGYDLSYQWYSGDKGDVSRPVAGAINNSFTTPELIASEKYWVRVHNGLVSTDSQAALATVLATGPEIAVEQPLGWDLVDGAANVSFGSIAPGPGSSFTKSFTIRNTGTANLTGLSVFADGANSEDFGLGVVGAPVLAPGKSTTFAVTFTPGAAGDRSAAIHIVSNDIDENPFDINLWGNGVLAPEIAIEQTLGNNLADGTASVSFGSIALGGNATRDFTIRNLGGAALTGLIVTTDGPNSGDFAVIAQPIAPLTARTGATTFTVRFKPSSAGLGKATIHIASNDGDENPFDINLTGTGTAPEIVVQQPAGTNLKDGISFKSFGSVAVKSTVTKTFTIKNTGTANLTNLAVTKTGKHAKNFTVKRPLKPTLVPGASTTFKVIFKPSSKGSRKAAIHIMSNDVNESPFDITLTGRGVVKTSAMPILTGPVRSGSSIGKIDQPDSEVKIMTFHGDAGKFLMIVVSKPSDEKLFRPLVEVSSNLVDWYSGETHTTIVMDDEAFLKVRDNTTFAAGMKRFIRMRQSGN
jgi:predicted outer membrane repeat protein